MEEVVKEIEKAMKDDIFCIIHKSTRNAYETCINIIKEKGVQRSEEN